MALDVARALVEKVSSTVAKWEIRLCWCVVDTDGFRCGMCVVEKVL